MDHEHRIKNVFDDLPPDLERLRTLRVWHALWMERIDRKIADLQRRQAEEERGRRNRPQPPDWIVELGIGAERAPVQVHAGDCYMAGKRRRPVNRDEARRLLATGLRACNHCQPDIQLHMLDLATQAAPGAAAPGRNTGRHDTIAGSTVPPSSPPGMPTRRPRRTTGLTCADSATTSREVHALEVARGTCSLHLLCLIGQADLRSSREGSARPTPRPDRGASDCSRVGSDAELKTWHPERAVLDPSDDVFEPVVRTQRTRA